MKVFLAGTAPFPEIVTRENIPFVLESFFYFKEWQYEYIKGRKMFLLDSGAFTFMQNTKGNINWNDYIDRYAQFVVDNDVRYFFELDIDSIVGYENVKKLRHRLEMQTGRKSIPVWHKGRGKDEFLNLCDNYPYVSIGGIVAKEITKEHYKYFPWFINEAHRRGCLIHGLGFTNMTGLTRYHFDTVDSTNWISGGRFGSLARFDGKQIISSPRHKE